MKFLSTSLLREKGCIKTTSRLQKWWLTTFKGYTVEQVADHPVGYRLGHVFYERTWVLKPPQTQQVS